MHPDDSPAAELWRRTLSLVPTLFGRLVYLSSLRDPNTGLYQHYGFAQRFSAREADKAIRRSHDNSFADWLCLSVEEQKDDLDAYLASLEGGSRPVVENWLTAPPFATFLPARTREPERELFLTDMQVLLDIFKREYSIASSNPGA